MLRCKKILNILLIGYLIFGNIININAQFSPQANFEQSDAIYKDSAVFVEWAKNCVVSRGYINMKDTTAVYFGTNRASYGLPNNALGLPGGVTDVVSLGDKGWAILSFELPIKDGEGWDFAVFENGILNAQDSSKAFLELAYVEVSSDSIHFIRFPSTSLTPFQAQTSTFGYLNASLIDNLAGKYIADYGTPFDLAQLRDSSFLDINNVKWVKIIDVGGCVDEVFASYDSYGNIINDPFPTPFNTCGFDLDAVGVINVNENSNQGIKELVNLWPNPTKNNVNVYSKDEKIQHINVYNCLGNRVLSKSFDNSFVYLSLSFLKPGMYFIIIKLENKVITKKIVINN